MEEKTKIILTRPAEWMNRARSYRVFIDDQERGSIRSGQSEEFLVSPGTHNIYCRMSWYSSLPFSCSLQAGEVQYVQVKSGMKYYWPLFGLLFIGILLNLRFSRDGEQRPIQILVLQMAMILPGLLYMLYYLTLGRKRYIVMREDRDNVFAS